MRSEIYKIRRDAASLGQTVLPGQAYDQGNSTTPQLLFNVLGVGSSLHFGLLGKAVKSGGVGRVRPFNIQLVLA